MTSIRFPDPFLQASIDALDELSPRIRSELHACSIHLIGELASLRGADLLAATALFAEDVAAIKEALAMRGIVLGDKQCG